VGTIIQDDLAIPTKMFAKNISTDMFPWYFNNHSTRDGLWFMQHTVIKRHDENDDPIINSPIWGDIKNIFDHFCRQNDLTYEKIMRCSINQTHSVGEFSQSDPHIDHMEPHNVFLLYLNNCDGDTIIYEKTYSEVGQETIMFGSEQYNGLNELGRFSPKLGKAVCFNGDHYHANQFCKDDQRRIVCVITFR